MRNQIQTVNTDNNKNSAAKIFLMVGACMALLLLLFLFRGGKEATIELAQVMAQIATFV